MLLELIQQSSTWSNLQLHTQLNLQLSTVLRQYETPISDSPLQVWGGSPTKVIVVTFVTFIFFLFLPIFCHSFSPAHIRVGTFYLVCGRQSYCVAFSFLEMKAEEATYLLFWIVIIDRNSSCIQDGADNHKSVNGLESCCAIRLIDRPSLWCFRNSLKPSRLIWNWSQ